MGEQRKFAGIAWSQKGKVSRRERFLAEMDAVIPWARLLVLIGPYYPQAGRGRQPLGLECSRPPTLPPPPNQTCGEGGVCQQVAVEIPSVCLGWEHVMQRVAVGPDTRLCMRARGWDYRRGYDTYRP